MGEKRNDLTKALIFPLRSISFRSEQQMRELKSDTNKGIIVVKLEGGCGVGAGKQILKALPDCFYAVDISGGYAHLYHHQCAGRDDIGIAKKILSGYRAAGV